MAFFTRVPTDDELAFDGFYDGSQRIIPEGTELNVLVYGGFNGVEEGMAINTCFINVIVTSPEFKGQKYKWNAKLWDKDAAKIDEAKRNLQVLDVQAGLPMTYAKCDLNEQTIEEFWTGKAEARAKFGVYMSNTDLKTGEIIDTNRPQEERNFIRGFGYLREKMIKPAQQAAQAAPVQQLADDEVDF